MSKLKLTPFVRFESGKCTEAMNFYKGIFGGKLTLMTVKETPMSKDFPAEKQALVMHSYLDSGLVAFSGSDMMRDKLQVGDNVGMSLECSSQKEIDDIFAKLAEGGDVFMKPEESFWGAIFGMVTDKYGVEWMLNFQAKPMK